MDGIGTVAQLNRPHGIALGPLGYFYFADRGNHQVRLLDPVDQGVRTILGNGAAGMVDAKGKQAQFNQPIALVVTKDGVVYIADRDNHRIRKMACDGTVTTLAGTGVGGYKDGAAKEARFKQPYGVALDKEESAIYVADYLNHAIRRIDLKSDTVTTVAGNGTAGFVNGEGVGARFNQPYSIKFDGRDSFYVPDQLNHSIRKVTLSGKVATIAGSGSAGFSEGMGAAAQFNNPTGIAVGPEGTLYITDHNNNRIRKIEADNSVTTVTGTGAAGDKNGTVLEAEFRDPLDLAFDMEQKRLYVTEDKGHRIRVIE